MTWVLNPRNAASAPSLEEFGGKALALARLHGTAVRIPEWFALSPRAYDASREPHGASLGDLHPNPAVMVEVEAALVRLGLDRCRLAVRSSAVDEDGAARAYAGMYETVLDVAPGGVGDAIAAVWWSGFADRVHAYGEGRSCRNPAAPAVMVQRMVDADFAGVAFSADPVTGRDDHAVIAVVRGLGNRLVSGEVDGDTFRIDKAGRIVERRPASDPAAISDADLRRVAELARFAARHFAAPQDIEWAIARGELFLLQSRPITGPHADGRATADTPILWDNSNIIESYGGVTTPLTFSFARSAYESVYRSFSRLMGVPQKRIDQEEQLFRNMLGLIRGRVFYNLLNWYRLVALFPGFALNRGFMEHMMGVSEVLPASFGTRVAPTVSAGAVSRTIDLLNLSITGLRMTWNRIRLRTNIERFYLRLDEALNERGSASAELSYVALVDRYRDLERRLLRGWDAPLVNDFFCMMAVGALNGLLRRWLGESGERIAADLIKCGRDVVSAEPVRRIKAMAERAATSPSIVQALVEGTASAARAALADDPALERAYESYLASFSDRCVAELKLESRTLHEDPLPLLRAIGLAAMSGPKGARSVQGGAPHDAAAVLQARLRKRPVVRTLLRLVIAEAKARTRDRENLRFERTRVFGEARRIFLEMGKRLHARGVLADPRDVFYLEVAELLGFAEGTSAGGELGRVAQARKAEFEGYARLADPPSRFLTTGAVNLSQLRPVSGDDRSGPTGPENERRGLGCSPGRVRGPVRVVRDPRSSDIAAGDILVAEHTDPGWVTLFVRAAGIVVERGSQLSHSAIVAREMGIPAVVSLKGATRWLRDGDLIELDGRTGSVTRLFPGEAVDGAETSEAA